MRKWTAAFLATIAALTGAATAEAAPIPVSTLLTDFTVIIDQNLTLTGPDIEGPVLVGGTLDSTGILNFPPTVIPLPVPIAGYGEVNVFGNVLAGTNTIVENSVTYIGGTNSGTILKSGAGSKLGGYTFPGSGPNNAGTFATDIWAPLTGFSTTLAGLAANSTYNEKTGTFAATPVKGVAVWDITTSDLAGAGKNLNFSGLPSTGAGIVNVMGTSFSSAITFNPIGPTGALPNVIFNFENATRVTLESFWEASILAPDALLTSSGDIYGNVVAENYTLSAETHTPGFDCNSSVCACPPGFPGCSSGPPLVPEPGSLALLGTALVASCAALRRRRV
jgi:choice-of-anchor A domain-containing protein